MESKYLKTAFVLIFISVFLITAIFITVLISVNKVAFLKPVARPVTCTQDQAISLTEQFIRNTPTYAFDGIAGSIKKQQVEATEEGKAWQLTYTFKTSHPGHGDRSNQLLAEQVTGHSVQITIRGCSIVTATCDKNYNLLTGQPVK